MESGPAEFIQSMLDRVLEGQRRHDAALGEMKADMLEVKERLGLIEASYSSISRRCDRIEGRLDRIERRLDLVDAH